MAENQGVDDDNIRCKKQMSKRKIGCLVIIIIGAIISGIGYLISRSGGTPSVDDARYQINTPTRIYFTDSYTEANGIYYLDGYFVELNSRWVYRDKVLELDPYYYGKVTAKLRTSASK